MADSSSTHASNTASGLTYADLLVRRMRQTDIEQVMAIESIAFGQHHWSPDSFSAEIKNNIGRYYALLHQPTQTLIGYCGYWVILDEAHITTIAVSPEYRGCGLGELLLIKMLDRMQGQSIKWVTLEVRASNVSAQQLYYKYHFRSMGVRPHYYQDTNEDAVVMTTESITEKSFRDVLRAHKHALTQRLGGQLPEGVN